MKWIKIRYILLNGGFQMGCCNDGNNQNKKVKEWGNDNQSSGNINIKFIIIGAILLGVIIYKFII